MTIYKRVTDVAHELVSAKGLWLLCVLLSVLCISSVAKVVSLLASKPALPKIDIAQIPTTQEASSLLIYPFGTTAGSIPETLGKAAIDAQVLGIITKGQLAYASIAVNGKKEAIYSAGDNLSPSVVIKRIEASQVVVRENGRLRAILLVTGSINNAGEIIKTAPAQSADSAGADHNKFIDVSPVITTNGSSGIQINSIDPSLSGLNEVNAGDVLLAANGQQIFTLIEDQSALKVLRNSENIAVTVMRDGQEIEIEIDASVLSRLLTN